MSWYSIQLIEENFQIIPLTRKEEDLVAIAASLLKEFGLMDFTNPSFCESVDYDLYGVNYLCTISGRTKDGDRISRVVGLKESGFTIDLDAIAPDISAFYYRKAHDAIAQAAQGESDNDVTDLEGLSDAADRHSPKNFLLTAAQLQEQAADSIGIAGDFPLPKESSATLQNY